MNKFYLVVVTNLCLLSLFIGCRTGSQDSTLHPLFTLAERQEIVQLLNENFTIDNKVSYEDNGVMSLINALSGNLFLKPPIACVTTEEIQNFLEDNPPLQGPNFEGILGGLLSITKDDPRLAFFIKKMISSPHVEMGGFAQKALFMHYNEDFFDYFLQHHDITKDSSSFFWMFFSIPEPLYVTKIILPRFSNKEIEIEHFSPMLLSRFQKMLDAGVNVKINYQPARPYLFLAKPYPVLVKLLLDAGADPNLPEFPFELSYQHYAVCNESQLYRLANSRCKTGENFLFFCLNDPEKRELLIASGCRLDTTNSDGETVFFYLDSDLNKFCQDVIKGISMEQHAMKGIAMDHRNNYNETAVFRIENEQILEKLTHPFPDLDSFKMELMNYKGTTDEEDIAEELKKIKEFLVKKNCFLEWNYQNCDGETVLFRKRTSKAINFWIKKGIDIQKKNKKGETALAYALTPESFDTLVQHGLSPKNLNSNNETILFSLARIPCWRPGYINAHKYKYPTRIFNTFSEKEKLLLHVIKKYQLDVESKNNSGETIFNILEDDVSSNIKKHLDLVRGKE